ncbi:hypothetical protein BDZ89DRAFT_10443 [Hymenopellis radicata]|nr:hypothetical protein BDZ89DRAFT_10443 [Hymenopellis radicata]
MTSLAAPKRLYMRDLPAHISDADIRKGLESYGTITEVKTMPGQNFAFVGFATAEDAQAALNHIQDNDFLGKRITVEFAHPLRKDLINAISSPPTSDRRLFLKDLPETASAQDMKELLQRYGTLTEFKLIPGHTYGFVEYASKEDALTVLQTFQRYNFLGHNITIEYAHQARKYITAGSPLEPAIKKLARDRLRHRPDQRFRIIVSGIPRHFCWQELKDFGRLSGKPVVYCDLEKKRNGRGFLEFNFLADAEAAVRKLNGRKLGGSKVSVFFPEMEASFGTVSTDDFPRSRPSSPPRFEDISNTRSYSRRSRSRSPERYSTRYLSSQTSFSSSDPTWPRTPERSWTEDPYNLPSHDAYPLDPYRQHDSVRDEDYHRDGRTYYTKEESSTYNCGTAELSTYDYDKQYFYSRYGENYHEHLEDYYRRQYPDSHSRYDYH